MSDTEIHDIARDVSGLIRKAEQASDASVIAIAELLTGTLRARQQARVRNVTGQETVLRLKRALDRAIDGGSDVLRVHGDLAGQYREHASGDLHPYTDNPEYQAPSGQLKLVGQG